MPNIGYAPERGLQGELLFSMRSDATQIADTTTETILVPDTTIPANYLVAGTTLRGRIRGVCSNVVTTPGTLTYRVRIGPLTLSTVAVVASRAIGLDTTAQTSAPFSVDFELVMRTVGASGTALITGHCWQYNVLAATATNLLQTPIPVGANTAVTVDTTVANLLGVTAKFSVATSPTNITAQTYILEALN